MKCVYVAVETRRSSGVNQSAAGLGHSTLLWREETGPASRLRLLWSNLPHPAAVRRSSALTVMHCKKFTAVLSSALTVTLRALQGLNSSRIDS